MKFDLHLRSKSFFLWRQLPHILVACTFACNVLWKIRESLASRVSECIDHYGPRVLLYAENRKVSSFGTTSRVRCRLSQTFRLHLQEVVLAEFLFIVSYIEDTSQDDQEHASLEKTLASLNREPHHLMKYTNDLGRLQNQVCR